MGDARRFDDRALLADYRACGATCIARIVEGWYLGLVQRLVHNPPSIPAPVKPS